MGHHRYGDWRAGHYGKRWYRSRRRAWLAIFRIWLRERRWDSLQPYACRWGPDWNKGRSGEPHIHIGHGKYTPGGRAGYWLNRHVVWPCYRARSRWRRLRRLLVRLDGVAADAARPAMWPRNGAAQAGHLRWCRCQTERTRTLRG